jgi:trans-aconitate methyltransferase
MVLNGELFTTTLPHQPKRILDIGTGTGLWAIEAADRFPDATVIGTDLSPIQPRWIPPNLQFYVEDCEAEWSFSASDKFDVIHGRALSGGIADWPKFYAQAFANLQPGGLMEMQDHACDLESDDGGMERAPACVEAIGELEKAGKAFGKSLNVAHLHKQWMIDAGFEDVTEVMHKVC